MQQDLGKYTLFEKKYIDSTRIIRNSPAADEQQSVTTLELSSTSTSDFNRIVIFLFRRYKLPNA
ncbi:MAG: hypothetical protein ACJ70W_01205, partial [Nitrososphaera sp.]